VANRYFSEAPIQGGTAIITGSEAHHMLAVMRNRPGDEVVIFDNTGREFLARLDTAGRRGAVGLTILSASAPDRELPWQLTLGTCLPRGERQRWLVEKAVELGVRTLVPLRTQRCVAQPVAGALRRLRQTVIEASKQCGRNILMEIGPPQDWAEFVGGFPHTRLRLVAHPLPEDQRPAAGRGYGGGTAPDTSPAGGAIAIGPEGGFTAAEVDLAVTAGWQPVDLGPRILRVETAAVVLSALVIEGLGGKRDWGLG
jgi:16S rRNA (uracil1498-N3)-methyltransferase